MQKQQEQAAEKTREWSCCPSGGGGVCVPWRALHLSLLFSLDCRHIFACLSACVCLHMGMNKSAMFALGVCLTAVSQRKLHSEGFALGANGETSFEKEQSSRSFVVKKNDR